MPDAILVLNAGSSSIKFGLFEMPTDSEPVLLCKGLLDEHDAEPRLTIKGAAGNPLHDTHRGAADQDDQTLLVDILNWVDAYLASDDLVAVGHRVVHGAGTASFTAARISWRRPKSTITCYRPCVT